MKDNLIALIENQKEKTSHDHKNVLEVHINAIIEQ